MDVQRNALLATTNRQPYSGVDGHGWFHGKAYLHNPLWHFDLRFVVEVDNYMLATHHMGEDVCGHWAIVGLNLVGYNGTHVKHKRHYLCHSCAHHWQWLHAPPGDGPMTRATTPHPKRAPRIQRQHRKLYNIRYFIFPLLCEAIILILPIPLHLENVAKRAWSIYVWSVDVTR